VSAKAESPIGNVEKRAASDFVSSDARSGREKSSMTVPSNLAEGAATASVLVIGNEILSGRTKDANLVYIAKGLSDVGVTLREARVVPDFAEAIIATLNDLRFKFDYVFTTGGVGPTHDDITLDCVALAFGVPCILHAEAHSVLKKWYEDDPGLLNAARLRMATAPAGSHLIIDPVSGAMGFRMDNVFVMPGIPQIMQSMFDSLKPTLQSGRPLISRGVRCDLPEGTIAKGLEDIQSRYPSFELGSYPWMEGGTFGTNLVVRGRDPVGVDAVKRELIEMVRSLGGNPAEE
jgi:molybdenum cofactor synthesis domain-containing protein